ncbi:MAG: hypothetical protein Q8O67_32725 [Deltaproteobacteria bacterium]|nr:hypothetical protein [Deltaproteobacteria bacterium]
MFALVVLALATQPMPAPPLEVAPVVAPPTTELIPATPPPVTPPAAPPVAPPVTAVPAPPPASCTLAVLDLEPGDGVRKERAQAFTDVVTGEVGSFSTCSVLSRSDVRGVLSFEAEKQLLGCTQESCLAELAGALGADFLVTGSLSKIESSTLLSLRVTDLKSLKVTRRATDSFSGDDDDAIGFVAWLTRKLMSDDPVKIGEKPKGGHKKNVLVERKQTHWRTLAWTGVVGTTLAGASATGFGIGTILLSNRTLDVKLNPQNDPNVDVGKLREDGANVASIANISIYATALFAVVTIPLFVFFPGEELVEVEIGGKS